MLSRIRIVIVLLLVAGLTHRLHAEEIVGEVTAVSDSTVLAKTSSTSRPKVGDKIVVYVEVEGLGPVQVGEGKVISVNGTTIVAQIDKSSSPVEAGQLVAIGSNDAGAPGVPPSSTGSGEHPWLGVAQFRYDSQIMLVGVVDGSPAEKAGLAAGDILIAIGDEKLRDERFPNLGRMIGSHEIGETVPIEILRAGETRTVNVTLEKMPNDGGLAAIKEAAEEGEGWAMLEMGMRHLTRLSEAALSEEQRDQAIGVAWFKRASVTGCPAAAAQLANLYRSGNVIEKEPSRAVAMYERTRSLAFSERQDPVYFYATTQLAGMYKLGNGIAANPAKALELYREVADKGDREAAYQLGEMYKSGTGVPRDDKEAMKWYQTAANKGHEFARTEMGRIAYEGRGVRQSYETAVLWFKLAADGGNPIAMYFLGEMAENGRGMQRNFETAGAWYEAAAKHSLTGSSIGVAHYMHGRLYEQHGRELGLEAATAKQRAIGYYRKAAKYNTDAKRALERLGVPAFETVSIATWGDAIDPDGDCAIEASGGKLTIRLSDARHDFWYGSHTFNAPRVLQDVVGDFVAEVKVTANLDTGVRLPEGFFNSAGMVVWDSESQYLRLERNSYNNPEYGTLSFITPLYDHDNHRVNGWKTASSRLFDGESTWLRISRRGNIFATAVSHDAKTWVTTSVLETEFPSQIQVGVLANNHPRGFTAEFEGLRITRGTPALLGNSEIPIEDWGTIVDPNDDCTLLATPEMAQFAIPAGVHDLWFGRPNPDQRFNAPRLWQAVTGDFVAKVKVSADWYQAGNDKTNNGAGLLVWASDKNFVRRERHVFMRSGKPSSNLPPMYYKDDKLVGETSILGSDVYPNRESWMRVERDGAKLKTAISHDGRSWIDTGTLDVDFPPTVNVGVHAFNISPYRFLAKFEEFSLERK